MKSRILAVLAVALLFPWQSMSAAPVIDRITSAREEFKKVLAATPDKEVAAIAFFSNDMMLESVRDSAQGSQLTIKGFRHGTQSYAGGYGFKPGETVDEAIANYRRDHLFFLEKMMEIENNTVGGMRDDNFRKALIAHKKEAEQMRADFEEKGLRIIGVELYGKARHIQDFWDENSFARVVELKSKKPQPAILPQQ